MKVDVVGCHRSRLPDDLRGHVRFFEVDRADARAMRAAFGPGADLLVDCACFTPAQAEGALPLIEHTQCAVMLSTKAVYADGAGRHSNSAQALRFAGPISEAQATVPPGQMDYRSPEGCAANKVAAEQILLDSALPVTVVRPAKIHGEGARPARTWVFVKRVLDGRQVVLLASGGLGGDHTCAAANLAGLVEDLVAHPGRRVLNIADPDFPLGRDIASCVAEHLGHQWHQAPLEDDVTPPLGWHPWDRRPPIQLDTTAATEFGYLPAGDFRSTVGAEIDWLRSAAGDRRPARHPTDIQT